MALTAYLQPPEYAAYGISDATDGQVNAATRVVNAYIRRPEGLLWSPDGNGMAAWMTTLNPTLSYAIPAPTSPGANVVVTIPNAQFSFQNVGDVVILDRASASLAEACTVTATSGATLTLANVQFSHSAGATIDFGLTISEEKKVLRNVLTVRTSRWPVAKLLAGFGRYAYPLYPTQLSDPWIGVNLLTSATPGTPPAWTAFDVTQVDLNMNTGVIWMSWTTLLAPYTDVRLHYVAGWSAATLPAAVKQAVANTVRSMIDVAMPGNVKLMKAGDATVERFSDGVLDADTQTLLAPYRLLSMG